MFHLKAIRVTDVSHITITTTIIVRAYKVKKISINIKVVCCGIEID